ncbi:hypothetical protein JB92DRAFT_2968866 [Gautieria morchelliformis]|nr:hypothetical protein JB92DRAFT_2968866 [Gautieria morchelliformis]
MVYFPWCRLPNSSAATKRPGLDATWQFGCYLNRTECSRRPSATRCGGLDDTSANTF